MKADVIDEFIDKHALECLNSHHDHPVVNAFSSDEAFLESEADHQLLIKVQFRQPVKLAAIKFKGFAEEESAPTTIKLFQGKDHIGFDEAEDGEPVQVLSLNPEEAEKFVETQVRFVKFQSVSSLQIFVQENAGGQTTKIQQIQFMGQPASSMDMKDWKPCKS